MQFDSHNDLWDSYYGQFRYTHGTPFRRAIEEGLLLPDHSVQLGMRGGLYDEGDLQIARDFGITLLTTSDLLAKTPQEIGDLVRAKVGDAKTFLSFDVDFFDPAFAPGTGTPEVGGPPASRVCNICALVQASTGSVPTWSKCSPPTIMRRSPLS